MNNKFKVISALVMLSLLVAALVGCVPTAPPEVVPEEVPEEVVPELPPKPEMLTVSGYGVGGSSYVQFATVGEATLKELGMRIRILPVGNDLARVATARTGQVDLTTIGSSALYAFEGLYEFASMDFGPQPFRIVHDAPMPYPSQLAVFADSGIKTAADLRGKRVAEVIGSPGQTALAKASVAFDNIHFVEVEWVEFHSTTAAYDGVLDGLVDAACMTGTSAAAYKMEASPHGIHWIPHPADDVDGLARARGACPFAFPAQGLIAAGLPEDHDVWLITYSFPVVTGYPDTPENIAYWWTKAVYETYDSYKDVMPVMKNWNIKEYGLQVPRMYPFHEGAIRYFKEQGWWTDVLERNQQALIARSEGLAELWQATLHEALVKQISRKEFPEFWIEKRAEKFPEFYVPITE